MSDSANNLLEDMSLETCRGGMGWGEGPAYLPAAGGYVFTDIVASAIYLLSNGTTETFRQPSSHANGNTTDAAGRLVTCEHGTRRVTRTEADGTITIIADSFDGRPLNSPNDVVVGPDGAIWFTDPPYGIMRGECGPDAVQYHPSGVYRWDSGTKMLDRVIDTLDKPNGLALSADGQMLFVSDTGYSHRPGGNHHIFRFDVFDGRAANMSIFAEINPGGSDGFRIDAAGYIWSSAGDGVHCFDAGGRLVGQFALGEMSTNLCFLAETEAPGILVTTPTRALVCRLPRPSAITGFARASTHTSRLADPEFDPGLLAWRNPM